MEKYEYNERRLDDMGIAFGSPEETRAFIRIVQEELEVRVGEAIAKKLSKEELDEFDRCTSVKETCLFLKRNCPNYADITKKIKKDLEQELIRYKDRIPGNIKDNDVLDMLHQGFQLTSPPSPGRNEKAE